MFKMGKHQNVYSWFLNLFTNKKILLGLLAIAIVAILIPTISFATEAMTSAVPEEQTESQEAVDPQEQTPEVEAEAEAEAEEPLAEQDASTLNETNAPQLQIFLPNGTTPATETVDYDYTDGVISVKTDSLIVVGNPNVSVTDVIEVNNQPNVHNLTLRNVNMNIASNFDAINIIECSQNASFSLNLEGTCTYTSSVSKAFINYDIDNSTSRPTSNNLYVRGSVNSSLYAYLSGHANLYRNFNEDDDALIATHFCGSLNIAAPNFSSELGCFRIFGDMDDLYFEDNVNVLVSSILTSPFSLDYSIIEFDGNIFIKDNAYLNMYSAKESVVDVAPYRYDVDNYPKFVLEDNACAYFRSSSTGWGTIMGYNYDIVVNTTGTLSCINDNNWSTLELYRDEATDPACKIEIVKGSVYLSGLSSGDQVMGCLSCDGCNLIMPEGASFRGAPNRNAGDQDLLYDVFLDEVDPVGFPNLYSTYINTNTNARVPAGTVQISYPPVPYPTPEEYNTAATGDNMGTVASLCMVVISASAGYVLLRILQKKNGVIVNV